MVGIDENVDENADENTQIEQNAPNKGNVETLFHFNVRIMIEFRLS